MPDTPERRHDRTLLLLAATGALASFWGLFLWRELLRARAGADAFCGFGGSDCAELWDGPFAAAVHAWTGLPVAAWGVAWGAVATVLPLLLWSGPGARWRPALRSAIPAAALAGAGGVVVLLLASAAEGGFCQSCALTYVLSALYAALAWRAFGVRPTLGGIGLAAAVAAAMVLLLLYPGLRTPKQRTGSEALIEAVAAHEPSGREPSARQPSAAGLPALDDFIAGLPPELRQGLADSLDVYRHSPIVAEEAPRALAAGSPGAPVRITEFTDVLCGHCADLHQTMEYLGTLLPPASYRLDAREFPLDGNCNPHLEVRGPDGRPPETIRCLAARARICVEGSPAAKDLAAALYRHREQLTPERVYRLAAPFVDRSELERCVASAETEAKLLADVDYAWRFRPHGTPLVLVNGRQGTSYGPFLYAIILSRGDAGHPAFAALPPPNPKAHIH